MPRLDTRRHASAGTLPADTHRQPVPAQRQRRRGWCCWILFWRDGRYRHRRFSPSQPIGWQRARGETRPQRTAARLRQVAARRECRTPLRTNVIPEARLARRSCSRVIRPGGNLSADDKLRFAKFLFDRFHESARWRHSKTMRQTQTARRDQLAIGATRHLVAIFLHSDIGDTGRDGQRRYSS